ncbi:MAG: C25 family cysteine peptidase [Candidatus Lokiarchaeota archaeon]|nr:C25 family cysteine peptidase [Candidatus Harpocratesius repetitus]
MIWWNERNINRITAENRKKLVFVSGFVFFLIFMSYIATVSTDSNKIMEFETPQSIYSASSPISASELIASINQSTNPWETVDYDMVFVIPPEHPEFLPIVQEFADWKATLGYHVLILDNYTSYLGRDTPEKLRNALISLAQQYSIKWLLLMGDTELIPIRYIYNPDGIIVNDHEAVGNAYLKPTDFYYADLTGDWNIDGDQYWGEDGIHNDYNGLPEVDYFPELYVGRFPVDNVTELQDLVTKTMIYEQSLNPGVWMQRYLAISGISDPVSQFSGDSDGEDEAILNQYILDNFVQDQMDWRHLEEHTSAYTPPNDSRIEPLSKAAVLDAVNQGQSIIAYAGHGSPTSFFSASALTTSDIPYLTNFNKTSFLYADACSTNAFDFDSPLSLGEAFIKAPSAGGIGYVGSMRISWYYPNDTALAQDNRGLLKLFMQQMFEKHIYQQGKALYESKVAYVNSDWFQLVNKTSDFEYFEMERKSLFSYMLLGDPSVDIYTDLPHHFSSLIETNAVESPYAGAVSPITITDENGEPVPYGRIILFQSNGMYKTFIADENGTAQVIFPFNTSSIDYRLVGHNMQMKNGTITLKVDTKMPKLASNLSTNSKKVEYGRSTSFFVTPSDSESGVHEVWIFISSDNFSSKSWQSYLMHQNKANLNEYTLSLVFTKISVYQAVIIIVDRVGNCYCSYPDLIFNISVEKPVIWQLLEILTYGGLSIPIILGVIVWFKLHKKQPSSLNDIVILKS